MFYAIILAMSSFPRPCNPNSHAPRCIPEVQASALGLIGATLLLIKRKR